jgi:2-(3-amino-3-carboxypropyl)histidine synthase
MADTERDNKTSTQLVPISIISTSATAISPKRIVRQQVPPEILNNPSLNDAIKLLPRNYNFEIHKTIWRIQSNAAKKVALQFPEGLLMYACIISDILESFAGVEETFIMGDVTFGACCIDDFSAAALDSDFLVHYGHSCLVPVDVTNIPCMYVFVDIKIDMDHLAGCIKATFPANTRLLLAGTIQFAASVSQLKDQLAADSSYPDVIIPRSSPLSPGEVLGCTAPQAPGDREALVFVADGRFHLEAIMMANPWLPAYRYDPYGRVLTSESYDHQGMKEARRGAIERASGARHWGVVLGTLGRQGNPAILDRIQALLEKRGLTYVTVLLSEVTPAKLKSMSTSGIDAWVQIACPRLSIDWGEEFVQPTLNPFEAYIALGETPGWWNNDDDGSGDSGSKANASSSSYAIDYYSADGGPWSSSWSTKKKKTSSGSGGMSVKELLAKMRAAKQ